MNSKRSLSRLTKVFLGCTFVFIHRHDTGLEHRQERNVFRQNTEASTERWYINLLYVGSIVENLVYREVVTLIKRKQADSNTDLIWR